VGVKLPSETSINLGNEGRIEGVVYYDNVLSQKPICYFQTKTPNKLITNFDKNKLISLRLAIGGFDLINYY